MNLLAAALEYAQRGWHVFPLAPGAKEPLKGTRGHLDATRDPAQISAWWAAQPDANVGVAVAPSGLVVLDVDTADGKPGRASLEAIDAQLPDTLTAITGRGGLHAVFVRPPDVPAQRRIGFKPGLDLIGEGYIVVAPSVLSSGGAYRWNRVVPPAPLPPILRDVGPRQAEKVQQTGTPIEQGNRNNALFRLGCALRDTGIGAEALARALDAENHTRFNPPLDDAELGQIVNSVLTRVQPRRDVALGAIVEQQVREAVGAVEITRSEWLENVALAPQPAMQLYSTTFPDLDRLIGGFSTRQLTGIIGPPSAGKSALVGHWLLALALQRPVLHVSLELLRHELFVRYAAHRMEFPWKDGLYGKVPQETMANAVRGVRIRVMGAEDFDRSDPWGGIEGEMLRLQEANGGVAPILAIDYIQLMARGAATEMRHRVGDLTMHARQLSQRFDTVVLGVFTTQRFSYSGKTGEQLKATDDPTAFLGAAKESGDIEFDCATLMFLDVDKLHEGARKPARIAVSRSRIGDIGFAGLRARLDIGKFEPDPSALLEMSAKAREAKRDEAGLERYCQKLLATLPLMPNRPWGEVQKACGGNWADIQKARDKLLENGAIVARKVEGYDENKRPLKGTTYVIVKGGNADSPPSVPEEAADADPESP